MKNQTLSLIWLLVEVFCIVRSAVASFNVTMDLTNGDAVFSIFTVAVIELSLFAMLLMSGSEAVAPIATLVLIAFSGVLQLAELLLITGAMDEQTKTILRYAVSFAPTVLLLIALIKRLTESKGGAGLLDSMRGLFGKSETGKTFANDAELPRGKAWKETRFRYRDAQGNKRTMPKGKRK